MNRSVGLLKAVPLVKSRWKIALALASIAFLQGSLWLLQLPDTCQTQALRLTVSSVLFGIFCLAAHARPAWGGVVLGVTFDLLPWLLLSWAGEHLAAGVAPVAICSVPLLLTLNSQSNLLRNCSIAGIAGMVLTAAGALEVRAEQWPYLLGLLAAAGLIAFSLAYAKKLLVTERIASVLFVEQATAATGFGLLCLRHRAAALASSQLAVTAASALLLNAGAAWLLYWLLARRPAVKVAAVSWLQVLVSLTLGAALLHRGPGWPMAAGAILLLASFVALWRAGAPRKESLLLRITPAS